ncbi:MAG TPA: hypothetical protein VGY30_07035 [Solirubrobacteraceae bacterium]|jgi:hypothetical protein|nr:hypothetical protein [Solirubrobacteraceae bacterium]
MNATATIAPAVPQSLDATEPEPLAIAGPQHMRALARANQVRLARADLKRRVAAGEISVSEVIAHCPWEAASMAVGDLLMSQRRWGQTRCRKFLAQIPMSEQKTIGSMTDRQRRTLAAMLSAGGPSATPPPSPWIAARRLRADPLRSPIGA